MNTIDYRLRCTAAALCCLLLTGCGGYHKGKTKGSVYRNSAAGFRLDTPDGFTVIPADSYEQLASYQTAKQQAAERDASDHFVCEYAAQGSDCEILICSEPNINNDTTEAFLIRICNRLRNEETGFEVRELDELSRGKAEFKTAHIAAHAQLLHHHDGEETHEESEADSSKSDGSEPDTTQMRLYVTAADENYVYLLITYPAGNAGETQKQMLLDSIHNP